MRSDLPEGYVPGFIDRFVRWAFGAPKPTLRERGYRYAKEQFALGRTTDQLTAEISSFDFNDFDNGMDDAIREELGNLSAAQADARTAAQRAAQQLLD